MVDHAAAGDLSSSEVAGNAKFDGGIPGMYDRFLGPMLFEPYAADLARRVQSLQPSNVLEVAAGTGIVTRRVLAAIAGDARLTATDLNPAMLDEARRRIPEDTRLSWKQADATDLPFRDAEFDTVICQFGVMFFPDKLQGLREFHRVLSPGGSLFMNVWDSWEHNPLGELAHSTIAGFFPDDPPQFNKVPFSFHDVSALETLATRAGFAHIEIETIHVDAQCPSAADAATGFVRGNPTINAIRERAPERADEIEAALAKRLGERFGSAPMRIPIQAHVLTARKPG
jgi:ubiquinone/menaquinone biosynthesis C-methylase UbiE